MNSILTGPSSYWYAAGSITQPIFSGGRIRNNYRLSKAQKQEILLSYQNTMLNAVKGVSNALVSYKGTRERRERQKEQVDAAADAVRVARLRYSDGNSSYLEVTDHRYQFRCRPVSTGTDARARGVFVGATLCHSRRGLALSRCRKSMRVKD
jgi:outer membrane protein TolC